tara:strand:+ start:915 stop:1301 length:387 start_codon:yes stop_codon:yes gene_type:complete
MNLVYLTLVVLGIIASISFLSMLAGHGTSERTKNVCTHLIEQSGKLVASSRQDANPLFAVIDATAAVANAEAASMFSSDDNIKNVLNVSTYEILENAKNQQKEAIKMLGLEYPSLLPDQDSALAAGWS